MIVRYASDIDVSIKALTQVITVATDLESLEVGLRGTTIRTQSPERVEQRFIRAQTMTRAVTSERFRQKLQSEQERLTKAIAELFRELQERRLFSDELDPHAASMFVQAYNLGFIVNDVSQTPVDHDAWVALVTRMLSRTFFTESA